MRRGRPKSVSVERVNQILNAMTDQPRFNELQRRTGASTTVLYKVISDYPLWSYYLKKDEPNA